MSDRRNFLVSLGATSAVLGIGLTSPATALESLTVRSGPVGGRFARHLNGRFGFSSLQGLRSTHARLVEIVDRALDPRLEQFELVFRAPHGGELGEGIYRMTSPSGEISDHLVQPLAGRGVDRKFMVHFSLLG